MHFPWHDQGLQQGQAAQGDDSDGHKVQQGRNAQRRHHGADEAAYDTAQAPHAVEGGDDAAPVEDLHAHGLGVQGNVGHVVDKAEEEQGSKEREPARSQGKAHQGQGQQDHGEDDGLARVYLADKPGGRSDGHKFA